MIVHDCEQGSVSWGKLRAGIPTASEFDNLVTPKFEIKKGKTPKTYLAEKIAEWWLGGPMVSACVFDMDQGRILEEEARPWYAAFYDVDVKQVGFISTDDGKVGCSPDGLIGGNTGIEIKCPQPTAHVKYLLSGEVPDDYLLQVHGGMYVTGFDEWKFVSYRRGFPNLVLTVRRDESIQATIRDALAGFLVKLDEAKAHLIDLNGGPPKRMAFEPHEPPEEFKSELPT